MKHTLPLFLLAILGCSFPCLAQDLSISHINHIELSEVKGGASKWVRIAVRVKQQVANDATFNVLYSIDNGPVQTSVQDWPVTNSSVGLLPPVSCAVPFGTTYGDTVELRLILDFENDLDNNNDTALIRFIIREKVPNDLQLTLLSPSTGTDLEVGATTEFVYSLKNVGTTTLTQGTQLLEYINVNDEILGNPSFAPYEGSPLQPGDSTDISVTLSFPNLQQGERLNLCNSVFWSELTDTSLNTIEGNHGDNVSCASFNLVPNSVQEIAPQPLLHGVRLSQGQLRWSVSENARGQEAYIRLVGADGKVHLEQNVVLNEGSAQWQVPTLPAGIYWLQIQPSKAAPEVHKIWSTI